MPMESPPRARLPIAALCACLLVVAPAPSFAQALKVACSGLGQELALCRGAADAWARKTGHAVEIVSTPNDGSQRLALFQQLLGAKSDSLDVLQVDVAQVGLLAHHLLDLRPYSKGVEKQAFPTLVDASTVDGHLVAMPWFIDAGLLYYRKDLLAKYHASVPDTWEALRATAQAIQAGERQAGDPSMWGYVWQGRAYEGLTCDGLEMVASYGGGTLVDAAGRVTVDNPRAVRAFTTLAGFVGTISPMAVLNYAEEDARGAFQAGHAVFMRNWPYAWAATQSAGSPVKGKVGVAMLPRGGADGVHAATLGGQELAVSRYSKHAAWAADLVMFMTRPAEQKARAVAASYNPTFPALYQDPAIRAADPFMSSLQKVFATAVARPTSVTGTKYNQVSTDFYNALHDVLARSEGAQDAVATLARRLEQLSHGGHW